MILAETFSCTVPSPDAIKDASITCVTEATHWPDNMTAWATLGLLLVGALTAVLALRQLKQVVRDSRAQTRPYVYLSVAPGITGSDYTDLIIENVGRSSARNLTVEIKTEIANSDILVSLVGDLFETGFALPPNARVRSHWSETSSQSEPLGMPEITDLVVKYADDEGNQYAENVRIDASIHEFSPRRYFDQDAPSGLSIAEKDHREMLAEIASAIVELRR